MIETNPNPKAYKYQMIEMTIISLGTRKMRLLIRNCILDLDESLNMTKPRIIRTIPVIKQMANNSKNKVSIISNSSL